MDDRRTERLAQLATAAEQGNIDDLCRLIGEDAHLLEHIDRVPFSDTPLHKAASAGHIQFAMEMMRLMPSFARIPNSNGFTPIHLALKEGHTKLVLQLLQVDGDLVRVKDGACMTPLHYVAENLDHLDLLDKFLLVCPSSIVDVTIENETALHIALKKNNLGAFELLVRWLVSNPSKSVSFYERTIMKWKDDNGNTVLHIAVSKNQTKAVRYLLDCGGHVCVEVKNSKDKTAWDILQEQKQVDNKKIKLMLRGDMVASFKKLGRNYAREMMRLSDEKRNALLVVAVLVVTVTYQAVLSPPGGVWQDDYEPEPDQILYNTKAAHKAGTAIGRTSSWVPFSVFMIVNTLTFFFSNAVVFFLLPVGYIRWSFCVILGCLWICYMNSLLVIINASFLTLPILIQMVIGYITLVAIQAFSKRKISMP